MRNRVLLIVTLASSWLGAQAPPPPPRMEGTAEASFIGTTGNSSSQSTGLGSEVIWRPSVWEGRFKASYIRNEVGGVVKAQALSLGARGQRPFASRASIFTQYAFLRDEFAGIDARHTAELGIAGALMKSETHTLTADLGGGYANEHRKVNPDVSTAFAGAGANYKWRISATSDLTEDARFSAAVPQGSDWRYTNSLAIAAKISTRLSLKVSNIVRFVNKPVTGFNSTDVITAVAIVAKF
jgi:putative salt-induced outer membrane protein YdiY